MLNDQVRHDHTADVYEWHRRISVRMSTHLQLTFENIARLAWVLAGVLSCDSDVAQKCAREAHRALSEKSHASIFGTWFSEQSILMEQLSAFCDAVPATQVWKSNGRYRDVFICLGARFLSSPDHVLECEGVHSRWQWLELSKRSIKLKSLNAVLRLSAFLNFYGDLPSADELAPHIRSIRAHLNGQYELVRQGVDIAPGARAEFVYRERFNLGLADVDLLRAHRETLGGGSSSPQVLRALIITRGCTL